MIPANILAHRTHSLIQKGFARVLCRRIIQSIGVLCLLCQKHRKEDGNFSSLVSQPHLKRVVGGRTVSTLVSQPFLFIEWSVGLFLNDWRIPQHAHTRSLLPSIYLKKVFCLRQAALASLGNLLPILWSAFRGCPVTFWGGLPSADPDLPTQNGFFMSHRYPLLSFTPAGRVPGRSCSGCLV